MIDKAIQHIASELDMFIVRKTAEQNTTKYPIKMFNVSMLDISQEKSESFLALTLINLEEDSMLKSQPKREDLQSSTPGPSNGLSIYILFTACIDAYETAVAYLGYVVAFFNENKYFNKQNSNANNPGMPDELLIVPAMQNLSFEQLSYIWSTLGGRQHPSVCYKFQLRTIDFGATSVK
jgi:hypothetical protein